MDIHVCKQCGSHFVYCRACTFRPIRYKDNGFCSKECYEASKNTVVAEVAQDSIEEAPIEVVTEAIAPVETIETETITVVEPTIKKETNTYKKKKNKY